MGRAPVLDERAARVPPLTTIHPLEVPVAGATGLDEVALVERLAHEPDEVPRVPALTERTAQPGRDPGAAADVAGEPAATVLDEIAVRGRAPAPRAAPTLPHPVRQPAHGLEVGLERRAQRRHREERPQVGPEAEELLERGRRVAIEAGQQGRRVHPPVVPRFREPAQGRRGFGTVGGQALHHGPQQILHRGGGKLRDGVGQQRPAGLPALPALVGRQRQRHEARRRLPERPVLDDRGPEAERLRQRGAPSQQGPPVGHQRGMIEHVVSRPRARRPRRD